MNQKVWIPYFYTSIYLLSGLLLDLFSDLGIAIGFLYTLVLLTCTKSNDKKLLLFATSLSILFIIIGSIFAVQPSLSALVEVDFTNRVLSIVTIMVSWYLCTQFQSIKLSLARQKDHIQKIVSSAHLGVLTFDSAHDQVTLSSEASSILELNSHILTFEHFLSLFDPSLKNEIRTLIESNETTEEISLKPHSIDVYSTDNSYKKSWYKIAVLGHLTKHGPTLSIQSLNTEKEIEIAIQNQDKKFIQLANSLPVFISVFTETGQVEYISNNLIEFCGEPFDVLKDHWASRVHDDDREEFINDWNKALQLKNSVVLNYRYQKRDGKYHYFVTHCKPVQNDSDGSVRWYGATFDNSNNENLKVENEKLLAKFQGLLQGMEDGFISLDRELRIEYVNFRAEILIELPMKCTGSHAVETSLFFEIDDIMTGMNNVIRTKQTEIIECVFKNSQYFVRIHATSSGISLYIQDITAEKASRNELSLLRNAIDKANDVVLITTADLDKPGPIVVYANDAFERVTGYSKEDIIGRSPRLLQGIDTEDNRLQEIKSSLKADSPIRILLTNYTKAGEPYHNEVDISPIKDLKGVTTHFVAIERDISDQKEQEKLAFRAHKMDSIGLVTGGVAHDFNNLLTIILGNCEILESQLDPENIKNCLQYISAINDATRQGVSLTRSLLKFSKRQPFSQSFVDLDKILSSISTLIITALGAQINFEIIDKCKSRHIHGDLAQIESLFLNMAINARDAMAGMTENSSFKIIINDAEITDGPLAQFLKPGNYVKVQFKDSGKGIPEDIIDKIFDPFFSTKALTKGTGLGLSMIYSYIEQSGGYITVSSQPNVGTCFDVYLPICVDEKLAIESQEVAPIKIIDNSLFKDKLVLITEDTEMVAKIADHILTNMGFKTIIAKDANEALKLYEQNPNIDLLFTDVILPNGMDGKQLADKVREHTPKLPIIFTSGFTDGKLQHDDFQETATGFLQKPYTKRDLEEKVNSILG